MSRCRKAHRCAPHLATTLAALLCAVGYARAEPLDIPDLPASLDASDLPTDQPLDFSTPLNGSSAAARKAPPAEKFTAAPPAAWNGKAGVDYRALVAPELRPEQFLPGASPDQSVGVAWASVTVPGNSIGIDNATVETRIDPLQELGKVATKFSRAVPIGDAVSVTLQNAYSIMQTLPSGVVPATAVKPGVPTPLHVLGTEQSARISIVPTDTTFSFGATMSSTDDKWRPSLSAEQKLFGGPVSVTGSVSETDTGQISRSLKAGLKKTW